MLRLLVRSYVYQQFKPKFFCTVNGDVIIPPPSPEKLILSKIVKTLENEGQKLFLNDDYAETSIIPVLLQYKFKNREIHDILTKNVQLLNVTGKQLSSILDCFKNSCVNVHCALFAVTHDPNLLKVKTKNFFLTKLYIICFYKYGK